MQVARVAVPPVIEKRTAVPWLFVVFGCLVFAWLFQSNAGYALGVLVCGSIIVSILESAYAGMYWCTAAFAALAVVFQPVRSHPSPSGSCNRRIGYGRTLAHAAALRLQKGRTVHTFSAGWLEVVAPRSALRIGVCRLRILFLDLQAEAYGMLSAA